MDDNIEIYVLTHKKFAEKLDSMYKPLLCGSENLKEDFGYLRDDKGDNISNLNKYYAELTGEYWGWKHSSADIIGYCHYRRFFMQNLLLKKKITKKDIINILKNHDIILPLKTVHDKRIIESVQHSYDKDKLGPHSEEYSKLRKIIERDYNEYVNAFDKIINSKELYAHNMFITTRTIANEYFEWLFDILNKVQNEINFQHYLEYEGQQRILGYFSEVLLNVFIEKKKLKVKEKPILFKERKFPWLTIFEKRSPLFCRFENLFK